jgi:hypothetical protein
LYNDTWNEDLRSEDVVKKFATEVKKEYTSKCEIF